MIVIVGCGARKRLYPCRAVEMYCGQYFLACWAEAVTLAEGNVYILSAKYGLLLPGKVIAPYDLTVGQPGAVTGDEVRARPASSAPLGGRSSRCARPGTSSCAVQRGPRSSRRWPGWASASSGTSSPKSGARAACLSAGQGSGNPVRGHGEGRQAAGPA